MGLTSAKGQSRPPAPAIKTLVKDVFARNIPQCGGSEIGSHGISEIRLPREVRQGFEALSKRFHSSYVHSSEEVKIVTPLTDSHLKGRECCYERFWCPDSPPCELM